MRWLDWIVVSGFLAWMITSALRIGTRAKDTEGYLRANRSLPWWAVGLSVMATQMSAITLVGTTGQAYANGMKFIQIYLGLPIAMVILSLTVVPFFYRSGVYTAYEFLEKRFDLKTRTLTAFIFLLQRGMSCGVIIAAPSIILSIVLGWNIVATILVIGVPTAIYTMYGGVQAVTWTDVKQMGVVVAAMTSAVVVLILGLPEDVTATAALHVAGAVGKLQSIDFTFNSKETYTFWSGLFGGLCLSLSYFGCDQSQVQRYLTAKSVDQSRHSLLMSGFVKIPIQALILLTGVFVFTFFLFNRAPMLFNPVHAKAVAESPRAAEFVALESEYDSAAASRRASAERLAVIEQGAGTPADRETARASFRQDDAAVKQVRARAATLVKEVTGDDRYTDVNYVFPTFILTYMPMGLVGLMIAAILSAAMSASSGELNALATATSIDMYKRLVNPNVSEAQFLRVSKLATLGWALFACVVAVYATNLGSLIQVVNQFGSLFYGSILGVFVLALGFKRVNGHGAFVGLIAGIAAVFTVAFHPNPDISGISFLWHNVIGAVVATGVGIVVSALTGGRAR